MFLDNRLVFSEVPFVPLVDSTGLLNLGNLAQNMDSFLNLALEQDSSGTPLLRRLPEIVDINDFAEV